MADTDHAARLSERQAQLAADRPSERECRIAGCTTRHRRHLFACRAHWRALPFHLRDAVFAAYRTEGVLSNAYLQAAENAEAYLENRDAEDVGEVFA